MPRYYDADELQRAVAEAQDLRIVKDLSVTERLSLVTAFTSLYTMLRYIKPSDVEPVRHGHWITEKDTFGTVCRYTCSCCGEHWTPINGVHWLRFCGRCPNGNCGAKMDGKEKEE